MRPLRTSLLRPASFISGPIVRRRVLLSGHRALPYSTEQRVQIHRPRFQRRDAVKFIAYTVISLLTLRYFVRRLLENLDLEVSFEDVDNTRSNNSKTGQEESGDALQEGDVVTFDDDEATFISLQFPKQLPRAYYKGSDPEWQEFVKLSRDSERKKEVRKQLADKIVTMLSQNPKAKAMLGRDLKWSKFWLDFHFPEGPPPEYTRKGLLIVDDGIAIADHVMPHEDYLRHQKILQPVAMWTALKAAVYQTYSIQAVRVKKSMGFELNKEEKRLAVAMELLKLRAVAQLKEEEVAKAQQQLRGGVEKLGPPGGDAERTQQEEARMLEGKGLGFTASLPWDLAISSRKFLHTLALHWKLQGLDKQPPGCCYVMGDVEVTGQFGRAKVGVAATYDPKADKFKWYLPVRMQFWDKQQKPKGGA